MTPITEFTEWWYRLNEELRARDEPPAVHLVAYSYYATNVSPVAAARAISADRRGAGK